MFCCRTPFFLAFLFVLLRIWQKEMGEFWDWSCCPWSFFFLFFFFSNSYGVERHRYLAHEESSSNYKRSGVKIDHFTNSELANASGSLSCRTWIEPANQFIRNGALWPLFLLCVRLCSSTRTARLGLLWKSAVFNSNRHLTKDLGLLLKV